MNPHAPADDDWGVFWWLRMGLAVFSGYPGGNPGAETTATVFRREFRGCPVGQVCV